MPAASKPAVRGAGADAGPRILLWLAYVAFTIYGSLVPLDFRPLPLDVAWRAYANLPMLTLGIESRADWIANGVLYVPVGYLTMGVLLGERIGFGRPVAVLVATVFGTTLALAVEFAQVYFPPRTVSLNDLLAECIGTLAGIAIGACWHRSHAGLISLLRVDAQANAIRILRTYTLAYCAASLFPYDFVVSFAELEAKLASGRVGWLVAGAADMPIGPIGLFARALAEVATAFPVGLLLASVLARRGTVSALTASGIGAVFGLGVEGAQLFIASGYSQGLSVATRSAAFACAALAWNSRHSLGAERLADLLRRYSVLLVPPYLAAAAIVSGLTRAEWQLAHAIGIWPSLHWMPFYYHYYTSEALALTSLLGVAGLYTPVGALGWAWRVPGRDIAIVAAAIALTVEVGKAFVPGLRPDPTNVLVAACAAWLTTRLLPRLSDLAAAAPGDFAARELADAPATARIAAVTPTQATARPGAARIAVLAIMASATLAWLLRFPVATGLLGLAIAAAGILVWRRPTWAFAVTPAALPLLDIAPWSGRFYLDEFDVFALVVLGVAWTRSHPAEIGRWPWAAAFVGLALTVGTLNGLWPPVWPEVSDWYSYTSPFNALRIVKGGVLAFAYAALWRRMVAAGARVDGPLLAGMCLGAAGTASAILFERSLFGGLTDLASDYRVTGPFSAMHTGGAYVECYLTVTVAFLIVALVRAESALRRVALALVLAVSSYALVVTFSRGGYVAFSVAACLALAGTLWATGARLRFAAAPLVLAILAAAFLLPVLSSPFAQQRLGERAGDLDVRRSHWADALVLSGGTSLAPAIGMGLGSFPRLHRWLSAEPARAATYRLSRDADGNAFLRLGAGKAIYFDQLIDMSPTLAHTLTVRLRADAPDSSIAVSICRKWMYASFDCVSRTFRIDTTPGRWQAFQVEWPPQPALGGWPVKLSIHAPSGFGLVDVDDLALHAANGANLIANGTFEHGLDRWFFTNDDHLAWHVKSLPIALYFDLGLLGAGSFGWLSALALWRSGAACLRGDDQSGAVFAALSGILLVGIFDSLLDTPRFLFLFLFLALIGSRRSRARR